MMTIIDMIIDYPYQRGNKWTPSYSVQYPWIKFDGMGRER